MDLNPSSTISAFPDSSVSKESICNSRDPGSIPGSERSPGEGIGYSLQNSWASLSMGFSRQGYWSDLPFPSPGDLPNPGIEPRSPTLQADALTSEPPGKPMF